MKNTQATHKRRQTKLPDASLSKTKDDVTQYQRQLAKHFSAEEISKRLNNKRKAP
jgi:hypothetical protein